MKANYPLTARPFKTISRSGKPVKFNPLKWNYCEKRGKNFLIDGKKYSPENCTSFILNSHTRTVIFFPSLKQHIGNLIPLLLHSGAELDTAGNELISIHILFEGRTIYLASANLFFPENPSRENLSALIEIFESLYIRIAPTPGSTAIRCLRRLLPDNSALWQHGELFNSLTRGFLSGGALHWKTGLYPDVYKYDIKAAYAFAMQKIKNPIRVRTLSKIPDRDGRYALVADINYSSHLEFSPLAIRGADGIVYHPSKAENVTVALNSIDLNTLSKHGKLTINNIRTVLFWEEGEYIFNPFIEKMEMLQNKFPEIKQPIKIIRNSVFGKFAESDEMTVSRIIPYTPGMGHACTVQDIIESENQLYAIVSEKRPGFAPYHNPLIASIIPAIIREKTYSSIDDSTVYVDTDGFISKEKRDDITLGNKYGDWELEDNGNCIIIGPRAYAIDDRIKISGQHLKINRTLLESTLTAPVKIQNAIYPNPFTMQKIKYGNRTIRSIKYPRVTVEGNTLFVTRSPTREIVAVCPDFI
jgi:hypothetical protein